MAVLDPQPQDPQEPVGLSDLAREKQFAYYSFKSLVENASREEAIKLALDIYLQLLTKDHLYKKLFEKNGI